MPEAEAAPTAQGKYQLIAELGHGGMADVFLAVMRGMKDFRKLAVVKRLRRHLAEDPEFLAMFLQEARIAARLSHPNVVNTFEVGHDGRHHFIAMEYLEGQPMSALLGRVSREKMDFAVQVKILIEALEGLSYAHKLKDFDGKPLELVHRDISPQNIFITYDGQVKLLDFGIAKALDSAVETRTGVIKGKLAYMSPEQAFANALDGRADLYSVGVIFWEAVAQRRRWKGMSNVEMMQRIAESERRFEVPAVPPGLPKNSVSAILTRALAFDPKDRYQDAIEFQAELEKLLEEMGRRVNNREVGKYLNDHFEQERAQLATVLESEIKRLEKGGIEPARPLEPLIHLDLPPPSFTPTLDSPGVRTTAPAVTQQEGSATVSVSELVDAAAKRRARPVTWAAGLLALTAAAAFGVLYVREQRRGNVAPAAVDVVAATPATTAAPKPEEVRVRIAASPSSAVLYLDGRRLGPNPYVGVAPKTSGAVEVRAENEGYETETRTIALDRDVELEIALKPMPAAEPVPSGKPGKRGWIGYRAPPVNTTAKADPTAAPPPPTQAPEKMTPPPKPKAGVVLDTDNPWKK